LAAGGFSGEGLKTGDDWKPSMDSVDPALWADPDMRAALARRDIGEVYRRLNAAGVSQRDIAALTGQSQSEVSEILKGRQVMAYDVLARIAEGFGIPRGWMGLGYDADTRAQLAEDTPPQPEEDEDVKRRNLVANAASIAFGAVLGESGRFEFIADPKLPPPVRIGRSDVAGLQALTRELRGLARGGNPAMPEIYQPVAQRADLMLDADAADFCRRKLRSALAELHTDAGWFAYDMHLTDLATWHYSRAVKLGTKAGDVFAAVNATWCQATGYRELGAPNDALKLYQLALERLERAMVPGRDAILGDLHLRIALALAELGSQERPRLEMPSRRGPVVVGLSASSLRRQVNDALGRASDSPAPPSSMHDLALADRVYARAGVELALGRLDVAQGFSRQSVDMLSPEDRRTIACPLIRLATIHTAVGDSDAPKLVVAALDAVDGLRSARGRALLAPLGEALAARRDSTSVDLAQRVRDLA